MAIAIVFGFVLCWVPWSIISLLSFFARDLPCGYYSTHFSITSLISFSNCAIKLVDLSSVRQWFEAIEESLSYAKYTSALTVVFLYVPMAVLTILYSIIATKLMTQKIPGEQLVNTGQRAKRNRKVLKMAIAIVLGFVVRWVPWSIITLLLFFARYLPCGYYSIYFPITRAMMHSYCAINPCICFIFSQNYRQRLKRLLKCFNAVQDRVN